MSPVRKRSEPQQTFGRKKSPRSDIYQQSEIKPVIILHCWLSPLRPHIFISEATVSSIGSNDSRKRNPCPHIVPVYKPYSLEFAGPAFFLPHLWNNLRGWSFNLREPCLYLPSLTLIHALYRWYTSHLSSLRNINNYYFLWLHLQHMEVPGPGVESKPKLQQHWML